MLLAGLALAATTAGATTASATVEQKPQAAAPIDWTACGDYGGECATLKVPIDYSDPDGPTFDLAIGRIEALNPAKRAGVLIIHPGGPGASGINPFILRNAIPAESALRQNFDFVSLDPRGVGRSTPIKCSLDVVEQAPTAFPATQAEYQSWLAYNAKLSTDCRRQTGPLFDHVDTTNAARDVDTVRAALGEKQISFFALSYGTQVGQQYAELFPQNLRAMAIDSNMDHSITSAYRYLQTTTEDLEGSFKAFARWCGQTSACALNGDNVTAVWDKLHKQATEGSLKDPETGDPITAEQLRVLLFESMYDPAGSWFDLAAQLKALAGGQAAKLGATATTKAETVNYAYPAIWCSDWKWNVSGFAELDQYRKRLEAQYPHTKLSPFWSDVMTCLNWQGKVTNPQRRLDITATLVPTLVSKGRYDVGTPAAWNYAAAAQIPNSRILEHDGVGHGQYRNSTCARTHIETYLTSLKLPPPGTRCAAEYPAQPPATTKATDDRRPVSATGRPLH
ncbi:alpha/beta fold hydrolase [Nonomuraea purpurea]|uniref:Alpha/beta fold hydrolase n=1 Tax=Nonomuraea purpurea TaxID=1849276 RepID=A0ABV8GQ31_9ACTN